MCTSGRIPMNRASVDERKTIRRFRQMRVLEFFSFFSPCKRQMPLDEIATGEVYSPSLLVSSSLLLFRTLQKDDEVSTYRTIESPFR